MVKARIRGVTHAIHDMVRMDDRLRKYVKDGLKEAAEHLQDTVLDKFGYYQNTGGDGGGALGGPWAQLKPDTVFKKMKKGLMKGPLTATGDMMDSIEIKPGGARTLAYSVGSKDPKIAHHVYGAPASKVPRRDPLRVTAIEERDECNRIIEEHIHRGLNQIGGML